MKRRPWYMMGPFAAGAFTMAACYGLIQDWYGKEAWIELIHARWRPAVYTVPLAIVILIWAQWSYYQYHYGKPRRTEE